MLISLGCICGLLLAGCISLGIWLYKIKSSVYSFARKTVNKINSTHKIERQNLINDKKKLEAKETRLNKEYTKLKEDLKAEYTKRYADIENEIEEALKDAEIALEENIATVDNILENRLAEITAKNTKMFNCLCNDKPIPCFIDLTEENTYRCEDCGTVYRVEITMNPVTIGKAISDKDYVELIKNRIENS